MFYQNQHFGVSEYFCKETKENFSFPTHMHRSFELIVLLEGSMTVTIGNLDYTLKSGDSVLIFPDQTHALKSTQSRHVLTIFSPDIVSAYYSGHAGEYPQSNAVALPAHLIEELISLEQDSSIVRMKAVLYSVCALLDEGCTYVKRKTAENGLLRAIFDFVESNYDKDCSLERLSGAIGYNSSYVSRYFKESTNMSLIGFVNRYRIGKACHMLKNTEKAVVECAYACGYPSLRSFNRNFRLLTGVTPKEYRSGR